MYLNNLSCKNILSDTSRDRNLNTCKIKKKMY